MSIECVNICKVWKGDVSGKYDCSILSCASKAPRVLSGFLASTAHPPQACGRMRRNCNRSVSIFSRFHLLKWYFANKWIMLVKVKLGEALCSVLRFVSLLVLDAHCYFRNIQEGLITTNNSVMCSFLGRIWSCEELKQWTRAREQK